MRNWGATIKTFARYGWWNRKFCIAVSRWEISVVGGLAVRLAGMKGYISISSCDLYDQSDAMFVWGLHQQCVYFARAIKRLAFSSVVCLMLEGHFTFRTLWIEKFEFYAWLWGSRIPYEYSFVFQFTRRWEVVCIPIFWKMGMIPTNY